MKKDENKLKSLFQKIDRLKVSCEKQSGFTTNNQELQDVFSGVAEDLDNILTMLVPHLKSYGE